MTQSPPAAPQFVTGLLALFITGAAVVRPTVMELSSLFIYLGIGKAVLAWIAYAVIRLRVVPKLDVTLIALVTMVCVLPMIVTTGGINSQFAILIPMQPLLFMLLGGYRVALAITVLWVLLITTMWWWGAVMPDMTGELFHQAKTTARAIWLGVTLIVAAAFSGWLKLQNDRLADQLHQQARIDPLTQVANRRALEEFLENELLRLQRNERCLALLLIDVDHFKRFNDNNGHAAGDQCLVRVAARLRDVTREGQDFVARFGGEEFVVVLTETARDDAIRVAEKLRLEVHGLAIPYEKDGTQHISITVGVASLDGVALQSQDGLLRRADRALYQGKDNGRNCVVAADLAS